MNEKILRKYASVAVRMGVNIQPGQLLVINSPVHSSEFARLCAEEAYKAGAGEVMVTYNDEKLSKIHYDYADVEVIGNVPEWNIKRKEYEQGNKCAYLHLDSRIPSILKDADPEKVRVATTMISKALKPFQTYTRANHGQWCIVGVPNPEWATKVFPDLNTEDAVEKLWEVILASVYITEDNDPIAVWEEHNAEIRNHSRELNAYDFKSLHFKNGAGTDLVVELVENHIWAGGCEYTTGGVLFNPNMPTEEVFCMPHRNKVNGKVVSTKPLSYNGKLIDQFTLNFVDGKAVSFEASNNSEILKSLLELDEGSSRLGEVALISHDSPISKSQILYYDTLFDENASCHLALGAAYPMNVKDGNDLSEEELLEKGSNQSMTHVDFMFGSSDMEITGLTQDGEVIQIFTNGNFVF